jgi:hypothetical protein
MYPVEALLMAFLAGGACGLALHEVIDHLSHRSDVRKHKDRE